MKKVSSKLKISDGMLSIKLIIVILQYNNK